MERLYSGPAFAAVIIMVDAKSLWPTDYRNTQTVTEDVPVTVLTEIEGILTSKPIGYASVDVADPDPNPKSSPHGR